MRTVLLKLATLGLLLLAQPAQAITLTFDALLVERGVPPAILPASEHGTITLFLDFDQSTQTCHTDDICSWEWLPFSSPPRALVSFESFVDNVNAGIETDFGYRDGAEFDTFSVELDGEDVQYLQLTLVRRIPGAADDRFDPFSSFDPSEWAGTFVLAQGGEHAPGTLRFESLIGVVNPIPEPTAALLFGAGILVAARRVRG